jgi:putative redox protein
MNTTRHVAHAVASTGSTRPAYRVDLRAGTHQLVADEPAPTGGGDLGPSPFELLLSALAACTATTLRMYADRHGWALTSIEVGVRYDLDDEGRGAIERMITVPVDLSAEQLLLGSVVTLIRCSLGTRSTQPTPPSSSSAAI